MRKSNYDKFPVTMINGNIMQGWSDIRSVLEGKIKENRILAVDCYTGVYEDELVGELTKISAQIILVRDLYKSESMLIQMTERFMTTDVLFGYVTNLCLTDYFDMEKLDAARKKIAEFDIPVIIIGTGAALVAPEATLVYADMARWEIQQRFRRHEVKALGIDNREEPVSLQYKRGYFNDWRICDHYKDTLFTKVDFWLDTHIAGHPKMIDRETFFCGIEKTASGPFCVVPFFDPGPWGGQWMKEICDLDRETPNFAWCFDCVPEENSLYLGFGEVRFEIPSIDLVFSYPRELLGNPVYGRFGDEFPIRFDFLDTMDGGNLSLQVHPLTQYIQEKFGMHYTQDESYYILDAEEDASVYLGVKDGIVPEEMINALTEAQHTGHFDAEKYVGNYPVKKHDHVLIPAGTVHCSGRNSMVLEISATPYIFTFKLWDWGRLGLDGRPRPINIGHGKHVIQWNRTEPWVRREIYNKIDKVAEGDGWIEEHTGLHECEFIETRRHWFTKPVLHKTDGSVNVLNLVEGREAIVESPTGEFDPFVVHYAETFIIPESVKQYKIRPYGESEGKQCATIKAFVKHNV